MKDDALTRSQSQSLARRSAALVQRGLAETLTLQSNDACYNRGNAKYDNGDYDGAIDDFTKAIEISPPFPVAYTNRGLAKEYRGDIKGAIHDYIKAIEINPRHADAYFNRSFAKLKTGDFDGAISDYRTVMEFWGDEHLGRKVLQQIEELKDYCKEASNRLAGDTKLLTILLLAFGGPEGVLHEEGMTVCEVFQNLDLMARVEIVLSKAGYQTELAIDEERTPWECEIGTTTISGVWVTIDWDFASHVELQKSNELLSAVLEAQRRF